MGSRHERWVDEAAGPLVRPYAITRGRTGPRGERLDLVTILTGTGRPVPERTRLSPEQYRMLALCRRPTTVADIASDLALPVGVIEVLADDLMDLGLLGVARPAPVGRPDMDTLRRIRDDLRAL
ncbi:DUF742 domain-containing protein [Actinomadura fibrosa]|uniref:DUF742 domain-containing protein n=1 Tax=Actinomadura fibrosa TaxID=111802 RepID=A0ABW2XXY0_9ACTN|nr:DUF742 domain-containing protein [Actinomadura fibrosa]